MHNVHDVLSLPAFFDFCNQLGLQLARVPLRKLHSPMLSTFFFHAIPAGNPLHFLKCPRLDHANHLNVNLAFCLSNNQARFENQPTFANFSKLTLCVYCNALFPHHPQTALSFTFVYTFRTRDVRKQALVSLREKTFSIAFQLVSSSPCQAWQSRLKLQTLNAIAAQGMA